MLLCPLLALWTMSYRSGWTAWQTFSGAGPRQQTPGEGEADWQSPKVTSSRGQNEGRHLGILISWMPWYRCLPHPQGPQLLTGCCLVQVNEMPGEASRGSSQEPGAQGGHIITAAPFPWAMRCSFPGSTGKDMPRIPTEPMV